MKTDILTIARVLDILNRNFGIKSYPSTENEAMQLITALDSDENDTIFEIISLIYGDSITGDMGNMFADFISMVIKNIFLYATEIAVRTEHAKKVGVWTDDTPEDLEKRAKKFEHSYQWNEYYKVYIQLSQKNIDTRELSLYECLIIQEEIVCDEINKSSAEILSMLDKEKNASFIENTKKVLTLSNFTLMSISCIEEIERMYERQVST